MSAHDDRKRHHEDWLDGALQALPRERASAGFTEGVLKRARRQVRPSARLPRRVALAAAAAVLLALTVPTAVKLLTGAGAGEVRASGASTAPVPAVARQDAPAARDDARRASIEGLLAEQRRLAADLESLRHSLDESEPRIYLGGDDSVDFVLDIGRLARQQVGAGAPQGVLPASAEQRAR